MQFTLRELILGGIFPFFKGKLLSFPFPSRKGKSLEPVSTITKPVLITEIPNWLKTPLLGTPLPLGGVSRHTDQGALDPSSSLTSEVEWVSFRHICWGSSGGGT